MDEKEHHIEVQREGSAAGLLAVVFLIFLAGAALLVGVRFWPALKSIPPPPTSIPEARECIASALQFLLDPSRSYQRALYLAHNAYRLAVRKISHMGAPGNSWGFN